MNTSIDQLKKLKILVCIVPQGKKEVIIDMLEEFEVNFSISFAGNGTSTNEALKMFGLENNNRDVVFSFIRENKIKDALLAVEDKFRKFKYHQSIAFSIPVKSIIGMQNYLFLSNLGGKQIGK